MVFDYIKYVLDSPLCVIIRKLYAARKHKTVIYAMIKKSFCKRNDFIVVFQIRDPLGICLQLWTEAYHSSYHTSFLMLAFFHGLHQSGLFFLLCCLTKYAIGAPTSDKMVTMEAYLPRISPSHMYGQKKSGASTAKDMTMITCIDRSKPL